MKVSEAIKARRSVKHYDANHEMLAAEIQQLFEAAMQAPTSFNIQNWRFVVVTDKEQKAKLRAAAWDQAQVTDASICVVMCADLKAWDKNPERYWANAPQAVQDILVPMIRPFYEGKEQLQRDEAMRSVGFAAQNLMLLAVEMGYNSCPMIGFDPVQVAEIVNLPEGHVVGMMITIGKATKPAWAKPGQLSYNEVVFHDKF
jgi:nitroreductase